MNLHSEKIDQIMPAFLKARGQFKAAVKDAKNPHFKSSYVTLDGVFAAITEALLAEGIAPVQQTAIEDGRIVLHSRLYHISGQWIGSTYPVHPVKADPQGEGSALTYARRYALMALVGIAPEDDDGNAATAAAGKAKEADEAAAREWIDAIQQCDTADALDALGADIARSSLSSAAKLKVRAAFSTQKHALSPKAAA